MNKGFEFMLKSFGLKIEPAQVQQFVSWFQTNIPIAVSQFNDMIQRQKRIEEKLDKLLEAQNVRT